MNIIDHMNIKTHHPLIRNVIKMCYTMTKTPIKKIVSVVLIDRSTIQEINQHYRKKNTPTDVLTFPSEADDELGDILIATDIANEQAIAYHHSFERELAFLVVHGFLHCIGFTHDDALKADEMIAMQETILSALNITR